MHSQSNVFFLHEMKHMFYMTETHVGVCDYPVHDTCLCVSVSVCVCVCECECVCVSVRIVEFQPVYWFTLV